MTAALPVPLHLILCYSTHFESKDRKTASWCAFSDLFVKLVPVVRITESNRQSQSDKHDRLKKGEKKTHQASRRHIGDNRTTLEHD